jgi:hypothetical protein
MRTRIVVAGLICAVVGSCALAYQSAWRVADLDNYRLDGPTGLVVVAVVSDTAASTRVTQVVETDTDVTITATYFDPFWWGAHSAVGYLVELSVQLQRPLGDRKVLGPDGYEVRLYTPLVQ